MQQGTISIPPRNKIMVVINRGVMMEMYIVVLMIAGVLILTGESEWILILGLVFLFYGEPDIWDRFNAKFENEYPLEYSEKQAPPVDNSNSEYLVP